MAIRTIIENGKHIARLSELHPWEKNPKTVTEEDFERLKEQSKLGEYKPLIITADGTILGGNTRSRLYSSKGIENVWVSQVEMYKADDGMWHSRLDGKEVEATFETEELAMIAYALSDNDQIGRYDPQKFAELISGYAHSPILISYKVDIARPVSTQQILDSFSPPASVPVAERDFDHDEGDSTLNQYVHGTIRQIVLYFDVKEYEDVMTRIQQIMDAHQIENNTDLFMKLVKFYEQHRDLDDGSSDPIQDAEILEDE